MTSSMSAATFCVFGPSTKMVVCGAWLWPHRRCHFPHGALPLMRKGTSANPDSGLALPEASGKPLPRIPLASPPLCSPILCPHTPPSPPSFLLWEKTVPAPLTWPTTVPASPRRLLLSRSLTQRPPWEQKAGDAPPRPDIAFSLVILGSPRPKPELPAWH